MQQKNTLSGRRRFHRYLLFLLVLVSSMPLFEPLSKQCFGQTAGSIIESRVKAAYIYNFTKFVQWKGRDGGETNEPTVICVLGSNTIFNLLEAFSKRPSEGRPIVVKHELDDGPGVSGCNLLYIGRSEQQQLSSILKQLEGTDVLTVSDISEFVRYGGMIGFFLEDGRVKIEVNLRAVNRAGLKISAKLLEIARIVP
jgi:hypothetical protein